MATKNVVITTDLSDSSALGLRYGANHVKQLRTGSSDEVNVYALYITPPFELPLVLQKQLTEPDSLKKMQETYRVNEEERLKEFLDGLKLSVGVTPVVLFSDSAPSMEILKYVDEHEAALVVMASQGKGALGRLLLGSTTQRVITDAKCPVLIVPAKP